MVLKLTGIKVAKNGAAILYLIFADDYMIFCKATKSVDQNIKAILANYFNASGQRINFLKSVVHFSKGTDKRQKHSSWDIFAGTYIK